MKHFFIINPVAGKADPAREMVPKIAAAFAGRQDSYVVYTTKAPRDAVEYVRRQCGDPAHTGRELRFYACGGDGTAREVASGILDFPRASVGLFPCGSGNDFIRSFPHRDFTSVPAQLAGEVVRADAIRFNGMVCLNLCNAGLDADVASNMPRFKRLPGVSGSGAYNLSIVYTFFHKLGCRSRIVLDDGPVVETNAILTVMGNGQFYGGNYRGAPAADPFDGLMDVCMVPRISRPMILKIIGKYKKGLHFVDPDLKRLITYARCRKISIRYDSPITLCADGECFQDDHIDAEVLPGAVRLLLPPRLGAALWEEPVLAGSARP